MSQKENKKDISEKYPKEVQKYLEELDKFKLPVLTMEEEKELAKEIEKGDEEAEKKLIQANHKLVVEIAKWYKHKTKDLTFFNLTFEGSLGLGKAVSLFKWQNKYKFSTLAILLIRKYILDAIKAEEKYLLKKRLGKISFPGHIVGEIPTDLEMFRVFSQKEIEEKLREEKKSLRFDFKKDIKKNTPEIIELLSKLTLVSKLKAKKEIRKFIKNF